MNQSFNLTILNFLISLQKGSLLLEPYSTEFKKFKYAIQGIELPILMSLENKVTPEIIFVSVKLKNTLFFETTETDVSNKYDQIRRYNSTDKKTLENYFSKEVLSTIDIPFIVGEKYFTNYESYFKDKGINFPLLRFTFDEESERFCLSLLKNAFSHDDVTKFFKVIYFDKVNDYIPFDLDDIYKSKNRLINKAGIALLSILTRYKKNEIFTLDDLCQEIFSKPIWNIIGAEKKSNCKDIIKINLLHQLVNDYNYISKGFIRVAGGYELILENDNREEVLKRIRKIVIQFLKDYSEGDTQQITIWENVNN